MIFCIFYEDNNLFLHQTYFKKPTPSQINLIKNAKNHFLLVKKLQKYRKCPALIARRKRRLELQERLLIKWNQKWWKFKIGESAQLWNFLQ